MNPVSLPNSRCIALALAASLALTAGCGNKTPERQPVVPVEVAPVVRISAPLVVTANGVVEPLQTVQVRAQVGGTITQVNFHEGDEVSAGQVLFQIDARPFDAALRQAQAALGRDAAQAENAKRDAERYRALVAKDYVTKSQADQAEANAAALASTLEADRATVENAQLNLSYTTIRAPITGRTGSLLVRQGNLVTANSSPLVVINQLQPILVRFPVPQRDFGALQRRSARGPVTVRVAGSDSTPIAEAGQLSFIDNAVDSLTGTVTAKARFVNGGRELWPGEYVNVSVELDVQPNVLAVPSEAVLSGPEGNYVFVVDQSKSARVRPVTPGRAVGDQTVIDKGLVAGEVVVIDGQSRLVPGSKVEVKTAAPAVRSGT